MKKPGPLSWLIFTLLALTWGSSFILMKKGAEHLNGWEIGAVRIFSAGLVFLPLALFHLRSIPRNKLALVIFSGVLGNLLPAFLFATAIEKSVNSSLAGILNSLTPLFVIIIAALFFHVKVERRKVVGVLIGFAGLVILSLSKGPLSFRDAGYTLLILVATIFYGLNVNIVGNYLKGVHPFKMATVSLAFLTIPTGIMLWQQNLWNLPQLDSGTLFSMSMVALLGVMGSAIATALFYVLITKAGGLFASLVTYAIPVVAIGWGLWAHEDVSWIQFGCLGIILAGVYMANK